jgi:hypothetical protein
MGLFKFIDACDLFLCFKGRFFIYFLVYEYDEVVFFFLETTDFFLGLVLLALNMCYFSVQDPRIPHICSLVFLISLSM